METLLYDRYTGEYAKSKLICMMDDWGYLVDIGGEELVFFEQEYKLRFKEVPMSKKVLIDKQMQDFMVAVSVYDSMAQLKVLLEEHVASGCEDEFLQNLLEEFDNDIRVACVKLEKFLEDKTEFEA